MHLDWQMIGTLEDSIGKGKSSGRVVAIVSIKRYGDWNRLLHTDDMQSVETSCVKYGKRRKTVLITLRTSVISNITFMYK